jgi:hypothetical protein
MIAWAGACRIEAGRTDALDAPARARWPIADAGRPLHRHKSAATTNT